MQNLNGDYRRNNNGHFPHEPRGHSYRGRGRGRGYSPSRSREDRVDQLSRNLGSPSFPKESYFPQTPFFVRDPKTPPSTKPAVEASSSSMPLSEPNPPPRVCKRMTPEPSISSSSSRGSPIDKRQRSHSERRQELRELMKIEQMMSTQTDLIHQTGRDEAEWKKAYSDYQFASRRRLKSQVQLQEEEIKELKADGLVVRQSNDELNTQNQTLLSQVELIQGELTQTMGSLETMEGRNVSLTEEKHQLLETVAKLEEIINDLTQIVHSSTCDKRTLEEEKIQSSLQIEDLKDQLQLSRLALEEKSQKVTKQEAEIKELTKQLSEAVPKANALKRVQKALIDLANEVP